jgi:hypothetical protein
MRRALLTILLTTTLLQPSCTTTQETEGTICILGCILLRAKTKTEAPPQEKTPDRRETDRGRHSPSPGESVPAGR